MRFNKKVEDSESRVVGRSNNSANANGGLVFANANNASSQSNSNIGSRLANRKIYYIASTAYCHVMTNSSKRRIRASAKAPFEGWKAET
nr:hypothetical protein [uncultured Prevotella sp.]